MLEISKYSKEAVVYNLHKNILSKVQLSNDTNQSYREVLFIEDICKRVRKSKTVLYVLEIGKEIIGLVALSAASIDDQPSLQIDYIFVSNAYRGTNMTELDNLKPFRYLVEFSINIAKEIKSSIGLKWLVLSPDSDDLKHKYKTVDFKSLNKDWMYLKL